MSDIYITLTLDQWNQVLSLLGDAPYKVSAPLIAAIQAQAQQQLPPNSKDSEVIPIHKGSS
jgi:hypothetical protein